MRSIIRDSLARPPTPSPAAVPEQPSTDDEELQTILEGLKVSIKIAGCGGAGSNTINRLVESGIYGVDLIAANTDAQHLLTVHSQRKILIGRRTTRGLGAGALPQVGEQAALESEDGIRDLLKGSDLVFLTCGLGGGTGTGSISVFARVAREAGALTIATVTLPFRAEGLRRMENAAFGLERLREQADTVIVIPNDRLLVLVPKMPIAKAFLVADEILIRAIRGLTDIITVPGLVNLDFNDLKTILKNGGVAMIGLGESGDMEDRAAAATQEALHSPLLDLDVSASLGAIVNVTGGPDMTIEEAEKCVELVHGCINPNARIIWGARVDQNMAKTIRVMVVLTGVRSPQIIGRSDLGTGKAGAVDVVG